VTQIALWQWAVIGAAALIFIGGMSLVVFRYFARTSAGLATERPGTDAETGFYGAAAPDGAAVYDGFSYRVSARFAGRVRVLVDGDRVSVCGPRGPRGLYVFWIWLQALLMAAVPVALVWAVVALDWRALFWGLGLLVASTAVMAIGAGVWPGLGEVPGLTDGHMPAAEFNASDTSGLTFGPGWASGGLNIILLPYVGGIDKLAVGHAVSWWAPDTDGREVRYAVHVYDETQATRLYETLKAATAE